jgi:hypothetical protein
LTAKSLNARRVANALNLPDEKMLIARFSQRPQGNPKAVPAPLHHNWVATLKQANHQRNHKATTADKERSHFKRKYLNASHPL